MKKTKMTVPKIDRLVLAAFALVLFTFIAYIVANQRVSAAACVSARVPAPASLRLSS